MSSPRRALRALGVAALWGIGVVPVLAGRTRCVVATLLRIPCPGCGLTRAGWLLLDGDFAGSLRMHPLLVPAVGATLALAGTTVWATWRDGTPLHLWRMRLGRAALLGFVVVGAAEVVLWGARFVGLFGGPVPV